MGIWTGAMKSWGKPLIWDPCCCYRREQISQKMVFYKSASNCYCGFNFLQMRSKVPTSYIGIILRKIVSYQGVNTRWWKIKYSLMISTSEYQLCTTLHIQKQLAKVTSYCQRLMFAWCHSTRIDLSILGDSGEMNNQCFFLSDWCV